MAAERLVVDASVMVKALLAPEGLALLRRYDLHAPTLLWSEFGSALAQLRWRGEVTDDDVQAALERLAAAPISTHESAALLADALALARDRGWAKAYDAEYVVLARSLGAPLMTMDAKLARSVAAIVRLGSAIEAAEHEGARGDR